MIAISFAPHREKFPLQEDTPSLQRAKPLPKAAEIVLKQEKDAPQQAELILQ